ncbi:MAG TPA: arginine--tRNA ligase [Candidatus Omnitrophota bacterium]|nr:arginine--tRNA ligase [Candidatus Omnitrophota bacterium]HPT06726.1 arginine--tRNA ligase [Candidatus Omnitrophota bacterium]
MTTDIQTLLISLFEKILTAEEYQGFGQNVTLDFPTDQRFGDLSTNVAMRLAKFLKKPPNFIAKDLIERFTKELAHDQAHPFVSAVKVEGAGFINFYLSDAYFYERLSDIISRGKDALRVNIGKGKKVLVEFVSANPTGPLSVAHARQAVVGDALASVYAFSGFDVKREYYLNDEGNQINILGNSVRLRLAQLNGQEVVYPEDHYQGDYIIDMAREIKEKGITVENFPEYAGSYILDIIRKELDDFGVRFDCWYSQKSLRESGMIEETLGVLRQKGFIYDQDGAVWLKSTDFGDDKDRVVIKSDGSYTYLSPDIAYHREKFKRGYEFLINLWGPDHHGYINRLKAAVAALGFDPQAVAIVIVQLATISRGGKPLHMSTRKGQYIMLREVLDEVGLDASRFFFVMRKTSSHLDFDLEVAKKQTAENPVYYCQYAHARISSIVRNSGISLEKCAVDYSLLKEKEELALIKKLWQFHSLLAICVATQDPFMVTVYLQELAETFHKFYDKHRVLGQDEALSRARLALVQATKTVLATGLELLGVTCPEQM